MPSHSPGLPVGPRSGSRCRTPLGTGLQASESPVTDGHGALAVVEDAFDLQEHSPAGDSAAGRASPRPRALSSRLECHYGRQDVSGAKATAGSSEHGEG
jgi:hypothetical protein